VDAGENGAFGLVVNRPTGVPADQVHPGLTDMPAAPETRVYFGGPVESGSLFALIQGPEPIEGARSVIENVVVTSDLSAVVAAARRGDRFRLYAGYAGWAPGQLESELRRGDWVIAEADSRSVFSEEPGRLWERLSSRAGARIARRRIGGAR
jgi:putative transcriptional regulator